MSLIARRLREVGLEKPFIHGEIRAYPIHHNVRYAGLGQSDCSACHRDAGDKLPAFSLAPYLPGDVEPVLSASGKRTLVLDGEWRRAEDGALMLAPLRDAAESYRAHANGTEPNQE